MRKNGTHTQPSGEFPDIVTLRIETAAWIIHVIETDGADETTATVVGLAIVLANNAPIGQYGLPRLEHVRYAAANNKCAEYGQKTRRVDLLLV